MADIKAATPDGKGVDSIVDAVASGAAQPGIYDTLRPDGPRTVGEVFTGPNTEVPDGVKRTVAFGRNMFEPPGGVNAMRALGTLLEEGKYKVPSQVQVVGKGFEKIAEGLETLKAGVSGTKLVVSV